MLSRLIPIGAFYALAGLGILVAPATAGAETITVSSGQAILTLEEALNRALHRGPELTVTAEELRAAEAEAQLAGLLPNPELAVSLENVAGKGSYNGTGAAELTIELKQSIELGGKRRLRRDAAELGRQLAANGQALATTEVLAATRQRYVAVLAAQERLALARDQAELAGKSLAAAEERIKAGKSPMIDRLRLQGEASEANLAVVQAEGSLATARQVLAASWGDAQPDFARAAGDLAILPAAPEPGAVDVPLEQSAVAARQRITTELSRIELEQAKAARISDPGLTVGWRQFEETGEDAWLLGISLPLPLFNQGQQAVAAANSRCNAAKARELSVRHQARAALRSAWQALADARAEAEVLAGQVVPAAAEAFAAAEFGYQAGKFGLLELLDAQRHLFEARQRQLDAQAAAHLAAIELQRLLGREPAAVASNQPSSL